MVMMWRASRRLISSTSAASVVLLPDPVGPPSSTSPRGSCASGSTCGGRSSVDEPRHADRQQPDRRGGPAAFAMQVDPEPPEPGHAERRVGDLRVAILPPRVRRERRQDRILDVQAVERPFGERRRPCPSTRNGGRRPGDEQQIAAVLLGQDVQPALEPRSSTRAATCTGARLRGRVQLQDQPVDVVFRVHGRSLLYQRPRFAVRGSRFAVRDLGFGMGIRDEGFGIMD